LAERKAEMMTILTERTKAVFKRFVEVKLPNALVTAVKDDEGQEHYCQANGWKLYLSLISGTHNEDCGNDDNEIPFSGECAECGGSSGISLRLFHRPEVGGPETNVYVKFTNLESDAHAVVARMKKEIDEFKTEYNWCPCGSLTGGAIIQGVVVAPLAVGLCDNCYIFGHERTEEEGGVCCVCLANNGVWTKLKCGHTLHKKCFQNIQPAEGKRKCPLCRVPSTLADVKDPYNDHCYTGECSGDI
jgi:hypothetical protein